MNYIAVDGCELELSAGTGSVSITSAPSTKVKCGGKGAFFDKIEFSVSGYSGQNILNGDGTATGSIPGGSRCVRTGGAAAVLEGDESGTITVNGTRPAPPVPAVAAQDFITVKVKKAGQSEVRAE